MYYLTFAEYNNLLEFTSIEDEEQFNRYLNKATSVLDNVTRNFYKYSSLKDDYLWRKEPFKKAVACQIEYFYETGFMTTEGLNSAPQSQQLGRTSISKASKFNPGGDNETKSIVCDDVYLYLAGTGLLNRGLV